VIAHFQGDGFVAEWKVRKGGPGGLIVGPTKLGHAANQMTDPGGPLYIEVAAVSYQPDEVPLIPGETYYIEMTEPDGFNAFAQDDSTYPDGQGYPSDNYGNYHDLTMTIVEYTQQVVDFDGDDDVDFEDFAVFAASWHTEAGDAHWNLDCDLAYPKDEFVGMADLQIFCQHWLEGAGQ
jgi:hypothetical protein